MSSLVLGGTLLAHAQSITGASDHSYKLPRQQVESLVDTAQEFIYHKRWAEAEELLSVVISSHPTCTDAYLLRAHVREQRQNNEGAIADYASVIHLQPNHHEARFQRGLVLMEAERYSAARTDFLNLLANSSGETNTVYYQSNAQRSARGITGITTLQSGMRSEWLNAVGLTYYHQQEYAQAQSYFRQAVSEDSVNATGHINLGLTAERLADTTGAIAYYQRALAIDAEQPTALHNLGALARLRRDTTLLAQIDRHSDQDSYEVLMHQGLNSIAQAEYQHAVSQFTRALIRQPGDPEAYLHRGFAYEKTRQLPEALANYSAAIDRDPLSEKAYSNRGNVYFKMERYALAVADYSRTIELNPRNTRAIHNRGIAYHRLGQLNRACQDWQHAYSLGDSAAAVPMRQVCR